MRPVPIRTNPKRHNEVVSATPTTHDTRPPHGQLRRLAVLAAQRLVAPATDEIHAVNLATTYYCNSRCTMCSIWQIYKQDKTRAAAELSLADIQQIFASPHFANLRSLSLTGGEPFLRRDLVDIAGFFLTTFPNVALTIPTDSVSPKLTIATVKELVQLHQAGRQRLAISVSLDGLKEAHDKQRGLPCFDKALEVLHALAQVDVALGVSFTITSLNHADLLPTYHLTQQLGVGFSCQFAQTSASYYGANSAGLRPLTDRELQLVSSHVAQIANERWAKLSLKARITDTGDHFLRNMIDYQRDPRRIFTCYSGSHSCFIDPYGDVFPCIMLDYKLGNAKRDGFAAVWQSAEAQRVRDLIAARACHCWTPCEAAPSLGRSLAPLPSLRHLLA